MIEAVWVFLGLLGYCAIAGLVDRVSYRQKMHSEYGLRKDLWHMVHDLSFFWPLAIILVPCVFAWRAGYRMGFWT